jgi:hypothetical protein
VRTCYHVQNWEFLELKNCTERQFRVTFAQTVLWQAAGLTYAGGPEDTVEVEVYSNWLLPWSPSLTASGVEGRGGGLASEAEQVGQNIGAGEEEDAQDNGHGHVHGHVHGHSHGDAEGEHETRAEVPHAI